MQYKYFFIFVAVVILHFGSCSDNNNPLIPPLVDTTSFTFPIKNGSYWIYYGKLTYSNFNPDSVRYYVTNPSYDTNKVIILYDTVISSVTTKCILSEYSSSVQSKKNTGIIMLSVIPL
jgi:hypothetical protein